MYKKFILLSALLLTKIGFASDLTTWLELKPSYFFFYQAPMNEIYDKGGIQAQGSVSIPVVNYLDVYGSVGYRRLWGHALNTGEKTNLTVIPVDIGLKPIVQFFERYYYFLAIGPRFFFFQQDNSSTYVGGQIKGSGVGLFANTGFNVLIKDSFLFGIFGEYSYEQKVICPTKPNVYSNGNTPMGGLAFGLTLGYAF